MALITVLMVISIITVVAVEMMSRQQLDIRRSGNVFGADLAYLFALGMEDFARGLLIEDKIEDNKNRVSNDDLGEDWAAESGLTVEVEGALLHGRIEDLQGRFNLNNLLDPNGEVSALDLQRFEQLLDLLNLDRDLALKVVDWIDADIDPQFPSGAEDDFYQGLALPYRTANGLFTSASELLLIDGIDYESYLLLEPHVTALPERTALNVNTASATLLASLSNTLAVDDGEELIDGRGDDGFDTVGDFMSEPLASGRGIDQTGLDVNSNYFLLRAAADLGVGRARLFSIIQRDNKGAATVVMRSQGAY